MQLILKAKDGRDSHYFDMLLLKGCAVNDKTEMQEINVAEFIIYRHFSPKERLVSNFLLVFDSNKLEIQTLCVVQKSVYVVTSYQLKALRIQSHKFGSKI